jgi:hypothetical protein
VRARDGGVTTDRFSDADMRVANVWLSWIV